MMKSVAFAAAIATASASFNINNLLMLDLLDHGSDYYGHGGLFGGSDLLPLLAFQNGNVAGGSFNDYLLLDTLSHNGGHHDDFLPMMMLSGQGAFGVPQTEMSELWALNQMSGHHDDFSDLITLSAFGGVPAGEMKQLWGYQQIMDGGASSDHYLPLMAATGQAIPTDFTSLWALNEFSGHHGYTRGHGYRRHAPRHHARRAVHRAPRAVHHGY